MSDDATERCQLLGTTALIVQAAMGVLVISSLILKRQLEKRKRPWRIWLWDVGKQLVGQALVHALNLLISDQIASAAGNNPCSLYFLNVLIDTTFGVIVIFIALKAATWACTRYIGDGYQSGHYGDPPKAINWWKQLVPYLASIVCMKLLVLLPLTLPHISEALSGFAHSLLDYLPASVQVVFAMALFPVVMNVFQFCVVDQFIKAGNDQTKDHDDEDQEYAPIPMDDRQQRKAVEPGSPLQRPGYASPILRRNSSVASLRPGSSSWLQVDQVEDR